MKARNREINIFNMSLLDILCGALGAFCFMMIVLLPYYKPGTLDDQKSQEDLDKTIKELKEKLKDSVNAKDMAELIKKLEAQIKELEGRVNGLNAENQQLQKEKQQLSQAKDELQRQKAELEKARQQSDKERADLKKENESLTQQRDKAVDEANHLRVRMPGVVKSSLNGLMPGDKFAFLDLYVWEDWTPPNGGGQPPFNPRLENNPNFWPGSGKMWSTSVKPHCVWIYRDVVKERMSVYVRLHEYVNDETAPNKQREIPLDTPGLINTGFSSTTPKSMYLQMPDVTVTPEHPWILVGFLDFDEKGVVTMKEATAAQRQAEWARLGN